MAKIICPGELLIDFVCDDRDTKLQDGEHFIKKAGGAPANVCAAIVKLGSTAAFVGKVGKDSFGRFLHDMVENLGVETKYCLEDDKYNTTLAFVSLTADGERDFEFMRGADENLKVEDIFFEDFSESTIIHLGSATALLGGELYKTYLAFTDYALKNNKVISFDPNFREALFGENPSLFRERCKEVIKVSDIIKVSLEEANLITEEDDEIKMIDKLHDLGAKVVTITKGKDGSILSIHKEKVIVPSVPVKMVDATGAGDAYIGAVLAQIAEEKNPKDTLANIKKMKEIIAVANKVGAKTTESYGAIQAIPRLEDIL
ncbi:carbohydrate kinase family protein [Cellulosilyticum sp. I15G10I2]|uniref:carbohydrate kinase family protein n=1 Tax=Cellulosilyticum sp. I15G10I2 TaxID=1892843 RepID=UPI00085C8EF2|nr:carbohydrate kinase [Cellulosilyticum sp. I15G10I2]